MPIAVLMVLDQLNVGGTETHVLSVAKELQKQCHRILVAAGNGPLIDRFHEAGIRTCELPFHLMNRSSSLSRSTLLDRLTQICKDEDIDVIHAHQTGSGVLAAEVSAALRRPFFFTVHGTYYDPLELRQSLDYANLVIAVSEPIKAYLSQRGFHAQVIPNGVDLNEFYPMDGTAKRRELGIPDGALAILNAGRLAWEKAHIAKTTAQVALGMEFEDAFPPVHAIIAGDGQSFGSMNRYAGIINEWRNHTLIHMVGNIRDLVSYYAASDVVVGTGRVALEAMACEKPVIAIGSRGHVGLVRPENFAQAWSMYFGDHSAVQPTSRSALTREIRDIIRSNVDLRRLGRLSREWVASRFSIDKTCAELIDAYQRYGGA